MSQLTKDEEALIQETVRNILALRKLTVDTKTQTSRAQGALLQVLSPAVLTRVARALAEFDEGGRQ